MITHVFRNKYLNGTFETGILDSKDIPEDVIYLKITKDGMKNIKFRVTLWEALDLIDLLKTATYEYDKT